MKDQNRNRTKVELLEEISILKRKIAYLQKKINSDEISIQYNAIVSTLLDGLFILSKKGFQSVNDKLVQLLGYTTGEFLNTPFENVIAPRYKKTVVNRARNRFAGIKVPNNYDVHLLHKNGKIEIPVTLSLSLLKTKKEPLIIGTVRDNSEKNRALKAITELEQKFNAITNSAPDSIIITTDKLKITYWNKKAEKTFGHKFRNAFGKDLSELIFPSLDKFILSDNLKSLIDKELLDSKSTIFEAQIYSKESKIFPAEISVSTINSNDENHLIFILRDITDRYEKERQVTEERNLTQYFMDYIPFSIYFKDLKGRFIKVNKEAVLKHGFKTADDLTGKTDYDIFSNEHAENARNDELKLISGEENLINKIERVTWKDGKIRWVITTKVPLKNESGEIIGTFGISRDFTQVKNAELIQQTLLRISTAVNTVKDMDDLYAEIHLAVKELMKADNFYIALYDDETKMLSFPYFVDEFDLMPEPRTAGKGLTEYIIRTGKAQLIDKELDLALRKLGETDLLGEPSNIWLGIPLKIGDKTIGALVVQDYENAETYGVEELRILTYVSEQIANAIMKKNSDRRLIMYSEELQELNAAKDKLFSIIAHDLKSPFQGLMGLSRLIVEEYEELTDQEIRSFVKALNESAEATYSLIENLLEWSRIQTGRMRYNPLEIDLFEIVEKVKMLLFQTAELKGIRISNKIKKGTFLHGDANMISSLIQNLVSNSIKFTNRLGQINISSSTNKNKIYVYIEDNGIGIDEDIIEKLFNIDTTFSTRGTDQEKGTGLGLLLCKEIVNRHGGEINIESKSGRGTKVCFSIPEKRNDE
jgi:PAS domain S-box-containing protein